MGSQLLEVATKDNSLWVTAEALDAIFDVFGDGDVADIVAVNIGLVAKLKTLVPQLKARVCFKSLYCISRNFHNWKQRCALNLYTVKVEIFARFLFFRELNWKRENKNSQKYIAVIHQWKVCTTEDMKI